MRNPLAVSEALASYRANALSSMQYRYGRLTKATDAVKRNMLALPKGKLSPAEFASREDFMEAHANMSRLHANMQLVKQRRGMLKHDRSNDLKDVLHTQWSSKCSGILKGYTGYAEMVRRDIRFRPEQGTPWGSNDYSQTTVLYLPPLWPYMQQLRIALPAPWHITIAAKPRLHADGVDVYEATVLRVYPSRTSGESAILTGQIVTDQARTAWSFTQSANLKTAIQGLYRIMSRQFSASLGM